MEATRFYKRNPPVGITHRFQKYLALMAPFGITAISEIADTCSLMSDHYMPLFNFAK